MKRFTRAQAAGVLIIAASLLAFYGWRRFRNASGRAESASFAGPEVVVRVSGKVRFPGIYALAAPASVSQAVARAGGLLPGLVPAPDWNVVPLAAGRHLHIAAGAGGFARFRLTWMSGSRLVTLGVPLEINRASVADLTAVPGISHGLGARIVARRRQVGRFARLEDLLEVKGVGPVRLKRWRVYLRVAPGDSP